MRIRDWKWMDVQLGMGNACILLHRLIVSSRVRSDCSSRGAVAARRCLLYDPVLDFMNPDQSKYLVIFPYRQTPSWIMDTFLWLDFSLSPAPLRQYARTSMLYALQNDEKSNSILDLIPVEPFLLKFKGQEELQRKKVTSAEYEILGHG